MSYEATSPLNGCINSQSKAKVDGGYNAGCCHGILSMMWLVMLKGIVVEKRVDTSKLEPSEKL